MIFRTVVYTIAIGVPAFALGAAGRPGATVSSLLQGSAPAPNARQAQGLPCPGVVQPKAVPKAPPHIHPAVVRVVAPGDGSVSYGSGTLVDVNGEYGLVITNYHVINEATGNISVVFPDGFYSLATVRKADRDWDLAALVIKRPNVTPVPLAAAAPRPGEPLTIAGYGSGNYRAVAGRCTQYVSPGGRMPFEMVELAASARQGDSGGPILNNRGELAGVLFGEGGGRTAGSYCGRVQWFLTSLTSRRNLPAAMLATTSPPKVTPFRDDPVIARADAPPPRVRLPESFLEPDAGFLERPADRFAARIVETRAPEMQPVPQARLIGHRERVSLEPSRDAVSWSAIVGDTAADQVKTFLAILGCCAVLLHGLKSLGGSS